MLKLIFSSSTAANTSSWLRSVLESQSAKSRSPMAQRQPTHAKMSLNDIRQRMLKALADLHPSHSLPLRRRIARSTSVVELWQLRAEMYQLIALEHTQSEAADRINALLVCFDKWIPPKSLRSL